MTFNQLIIYIMAGGVLLGALDRMLGNKFGLGKQFEEGFNSLGPLALGMVGIMTLTPLISYLLGPVIIPLFTSIGADPSMLAIILANDMGGYPLAMELAQDEQAGLLAGLIVASMFGCTIVFSIPVGLGLIRHEDRPFFAKGLLIGMVTIPVGGVLGGLIAGFDPKMVLINHVPVVALSVLFVVGLVFVPRKMVAGALLFGKFIVIVITLGLGTAAFQHLTGFVILPKTLPILDAMKVVAEIGIVLLGTFPVLHLVVKALDKPLSELGRKLGMDGVSAACIVVTLANSIPVYKLMKDMNPKGKVINTAWLVPATAALGDHLGFTAAVRSDMIASVLLAKLIAGVLAIGLAVYFCKDLSYEIEQSQKMKQEAEAKEAKKGADEEATNRGTENG